MRSQKLEFPNAQGLPLAARLEMPVNQHPHTFALFAHCFTCSKDLQAARNISRAMSQAGFAVLRFDFTGLGESEGDFADSNFSSNVEDLAAAARFLEREYRPPALLIGHSLGGAAVVCAAAQLEFIKAVVTVGAPFDPNHVQHLLGEYKAEIEARGEAEVVLAGRPFTVKKQFLEDIRSQNLEGHLENLDKALLIMHSPQDLTVSIENAARLYHAARHPKSFISLDGADHLLSGSRHSRYAGQLIASWSECYIDKPEQEKLKAEKQIAVRLGDTGYTTDVMVRHHSLTADEPERVGGNDFGPSPYELLSAGLGACTAMTLQMYARRKKWDLQEVTVHIDHYKDYAKDLDHCEETDAKIDHFERVMELEGDLDEKQIRRLLEIANKCPVHRTLHNPVKITTHLKEPRKEG